MRTLILLFFFILSFFFRGLSQDVKPGSISTRLADFKGSTSVDFSTGILNYNIPLFTIRQDGFQLPVSMSYKAQGIKCDETPGLSGLGWALDYSTCSITRTLRGSAADEDIVHGILYFPIPADSIGRANHADSINSGKIDGESDIFTLNVHGQVIKFILQKSGNQFLAKPLHKTDVSIQCIYQSYTITGWNIIDGGGNLYELKAAQPSDVYVGNNTPGSCYFQPLITSWYVTRIKPLNNEEIRFEYEDYDYVERYTSRSKTLINYNRSMYVPNINNPALRAQLSNLPASSGGNSQMQALQQQLNYLTQSLIQVQQTMRDQTSFNSEGLNTLNNSVVDNYKTDIDVVISQMNYVGATTYNVNSQANSILSQLYSMSAKSSDSSFSGQENMFTNKLLKKIVFRNGEVDISYKKISDNCFVYSRIEQKNLSNERIFSLVFDVIKGGYLKSVQLLNKADQLNKAYTFTYYNENDNDPNNDAVLGVARDYWGYYNGKTTNNTLMPNDFLYSFSNKDQSINLPVFSVMSNGGGTANRKPDTAWTKARSLQSVISEKGDKISFKYESNEVYSKDLDTTVLMGGLRIKSVTINDGIKDQVTSYKYKFPLLSNPSRQRSTGRLNEWEQTSFGWNYLYVSGGIDSYAFSDPIYLGTLFDDNSNNGVLYHYVEVVSPDSSATGYKYPEVYAQFYGNYPVNKYPWPHNSELDKALLATIYYNKDGRIVKVDRNSYAYPTQLLGNRVQEFNLLKGSYNYFVDGGSVQPSGIVQIKKEPVHFNQADLLTTYPNSADAKYTVTCNNITYTINPYNEIYLPNYPQRLIHDSYAVNYNLPLQSALLLSEQQSIIFGDYDMSHAYDSSNYPGPPSERAYEYERLINNNNAPRVATAMDYTYNSLLYPVTIRTTDSKQHILLKRVKYVSDYQLDPASPVSVLQQQHDYQAVVETQSWKSLDNGSSFLLTNGNIKDFATNVIDTVSYVFPVTEYLINNTHPADLSVLGYTETPFISAPYTTEFWENKNLYKAESYYHWSVINAFSRMDQQSDRTNYNVTVNKYSPYTGAKLFTGTNCTYDGIIAADQSPFQVHSYYATAYGKFSQAPAGLYLAKNYTYAYLSTLGYTQLQSVYFDISAFDNVAIATDALNQLTNFANTWPGNYNAVAGLPLYKDIVKLLSVISGKQPVDSFSQALGKYIYDYVHDSQTGYQSITLFQTNLAGKGVAIGLIEAYIYNIYTVLTTTLSATPGFMDFSLYENLFSERRNVLDYIKVDPVTFATLYKTYDMKINSSVLSGKLINMYFMGSASVGVRVVYTDGTYSAYQTVVFNGSQTIQKQTIDLSSFSNYQSIKGLQLNLSQSDLAGSLSYFCVVPANTPFTAYTYLPDGNRDLSFDQNGQYKEGFYNSFNEQYFEKNTKGEILSADTLIYSNRNMPVTKMLKITLTNNYNIQTAGINPQIESLTSIRDSTRSIWLPDITLGILPSEIRNIEIPSAHYHFVINVNASTYTLKINGVAVSPVAGSPNETAYDIDASNMTSMNITIQP